MNSRFLRAAITAASVFLVATGALAQQAVTPITLTAASFTPASTDLGVKLIDVIFGTQNAATATTTVNGFAAAINVLNLGAIAFGTLMFTYIAVIGTLKSAEDGELLGKKWSSMWVPLRFVMVIGLMVPAASGYSSGEMAVIWLAKMGSGLASAVWQAGGQVIATGGEGATATVNSPGYASALDTSMRKILAAEICSAGYRDRFADSLGGGASSFGMNITQQSDGSYLAEWGWHGDPNSQTWLPRECGKLQTPGLQAQQQQQLTMNDEHHRHACQRHSDGRHSADSSPGVGHHGGTQRAAACCGANRFGHDVVVEDRTHNGHQCGSRRRSVGVRPGDAGGGAGALCEHTDWQQHSHEHLSTRLDYVRHGLVHDG
jgi:hypothetical protein